VSMPSAATAVPPVAINAGVSLDFADSETLRRCCKLRQESPILGKIQECTGRLSGSNAKALTIENEDEVGGDFCRELRVVSTVSER